MQINTGGVTAGQSRWRGQNADSPILASRPFIVTAGARCEVCAAGSQ